MKLRYYLRGLGIGMLVAALVLILSGNTGGKMSDEAVRHRAAELGMVEKDKTVLGDIGDEVSDGQPEDIGQNAGTEDAAVSKEENDGTAGETDTAPEEEKDITAEGTGGTSGEEAAGTLNEPEESPEAEASTEAAEAVEEEQSLAEQIEQRADEVAGRAREVAENSVSVNTVTFDVRQGDSSYSVARRAKELGLVESEEDFDIFLCQNGYDKRISVGSYEIAVGATQKEIADIVTKSE